MQARRQLKDQLSDARRRSFEGRRAELALLQRLVDGSEEPTRVVFLHAPGGVGKTTLLREFETHCAQRKIDTLRIDGRDIAGSADGVRTAVAAGLRVPVGDLTPASFDGVGALIIDTFEEMAELEPWLRDEFLPELPESICVCLAGRQPPSIDWTTDSGWAPLLRTIALRNFDPDESRRFLQRRGVPESAIPAIQERTYGHPLALALAAEACERETDATFDEISSRGVLLALLERYQREIPDRLHRDALEASAIARVTTEPMLRSMLKTDDASDLFEWLSARSFMENSSGGIFPHDLIRNALVAELASRDPDRRRELHSRARSHYLATLADLSEHPIGNTLLEMVYNLTYLHRDNPVVRGMYSLNAHEAPRPGRPRQDDWPRIEASIERTRGPKSVPWMRYWYERQPDFSYVVRNGRDETLGFAQLIKLQHSNLDEVQADPVTLGLWHYLERESPLRGKECAIVTRFWLSLEHDQQASSESLFLFLHTLGLYFTTPGLAYSFASFENPDMWAAPFQYMNFKRLEDADYRDDCHEMGVYGHDWRRVSVEAWQSLLFDRELDPEAQFPPEAGVEAALVLSRVEFDSAVKEALKSFHHPDALAENPLLRSRLVLEGRNSQRRPASVLSERVHEAARVLAADPAHVRHHAALHRTYLEPVGTQERAAERLGLPFSTYRRHLQRGVDALTELLWRREIG